MKLCEGRVAIVTGAGRGLGRAYACMLAQHGAKVVVNDLGTSTDGSLGKESPAKEVVDYITGFGGEAVADLSDVSNWEAGKQLIDSTVERFGALHVLVNNAGILRDSPFAEMSESDWDAVIKVHLKGTFVPSRHAVNYWMKAANKNTIDARIINITSHSALYALTNQANYVAAKGGIASMTQALARELSGHNITVNAVAPRANTRMNEWTRKWTPEQMVARNPEWVAALITWLASRESGSINGRIFEGGGIGLGITESWQHGPVTAASKDPAELGAEILRIVKFARANAGIERDTWFDP